MRDEIFANQKRLGVIPANTQLTPWPDDLPKWDTLDPTARSCSPVKAEVFAAYVAYSDHEIGRVIQAGRRRRQARQHPGHLYRGRQRHERRRVTLGTPSEVITI